MGIDELGFLVRQVVLDPGEEGWPGAAGVGQRPVGIRCFNSSNQLRMTLMRSVSGQCYVPGCSR